MTDCETFEVHCDRTFLLYHRKAYKNAKRDKVAPLGAGVGEVVGANVRFEENR